MRATRIASNGAQAPSGGWHPTCTHPRLYRFHLIFHSVRLQRPRFTKSTGEEARKNEVSAVYIALFVFLRDSRGSHFLKGQGRNVITALHEQYDFMIAFFQRNMKERGVGIGAPVRGFVRSRFELANRLVVYQQFRAGLSAGGRTVTQNDAIVARFCDAHGVFDPFAGHDAANNIDTGVNRRGEKGVGSNFCRRGEKGVGSNFCRYLHKIGDMVISDKYGLFLYLLFGRPFGLSSDSRPRTS